MSKPLSPPPPMRSPAAPTDVGAEDLELIDAIARIDDLGLFGLVWMDDALFVRRAYGRIAAFVRVGALATDSLPILHGIEGDILALRGELTQMIEVPHASIADASGSADKLNFTMFWSRTGGFIAAIDRSESQAELELELSRQMRARLMAEAENAAMSRDLSRANEDLEAFASIVSHDLKAPLRHMRWLASDARARFGPCEGAFDDIERHAARMSDMLTGLHAYSSLGRKYEAAEPVDTRALIAEVARAMDAPGFVVAVEGEWPTLTTLRAQLDLVLRNLIANAVQHHDREHGRIAVCCADSPDALVITIDDDGPGISPDHQDAIFLPFRTLASEAGRGSTGMGLAMVARTMAAVGGAVTVASNPHLRRGSIFAVQWPKLIDVR